MKLLELEYNSAYTVNITAISQVREVGDHGRRSAGVLTTVWTCEYMC